MQITILALGSRGDVQPLLALAAGLQLTGQHEVSFVTSNDFERVVRNHGLDFFSLGVNARELLGTEAAWDVLESGRNVIQGMWQIVRMMRPTLEQLVERVWQASQEAEAIIFSTLGVGAYHIAEKQRIPCFWALPFPFFNRTRSFPSLAFPVLPLGGCYNLLTHIMTEQLAQQLIGRFINRWRQERLGLPPISLLKWPYGKRNGQPVPMLHSYSPAVVPKPPDWGEYIHVTGYWFLDHSLDWHPPADLVSFLEAGPPPVYVGFGSMSSRDPEATTEIVLEALKRSGQRGLVATGWGGLKNIDLPDDVFKLKIGASRLAIPARGGGGASRWSRNHGCRVASRCAIGAGAALWRSVILGAAGSEARCWTKSNTAKENDSREVVCSDCHSGQR